MLKRVDEEVLGVLARMGTRGKVLCSLDEQLPRPLYERLNKVLEGMGGKWNRREKGHVFADVPDLADRIEAICATGDYHCQKTADQLLGFFQTPGPLAAQLAVEIFSAVGPEPWVLEPSAGEGRLAEALVWAGVPKSRVICSELDDKRAARLRLNGYTTLGGDFLARADHGVGQAFDAILMNPPFTKGADVRHVDHALTFQRPGGVLRAIASAGLSFREDRPTKALRTRVAEMGGTITALPDGSFTSEGTDVRTVLVRIGGAAA